MVIHLSRDVAEWSPAIAGLIVCAIGWTWMKIEMRRRRKRDAARHLPAE